MNQSLQIMYKNHQLNISYFLRPGADKTLFYLHGGACSKDDFQDSINVPELQKYTLVSYDYPGCGHSTYPESAQFDIDDLVEITHSVISQLKLKNIILIGHSTEGLVALKYILKYGNIQGFISVEGNVHSDNCNFSRKVSKQTLEEFTTSGIQELISTLKSSHNKGFETWANTIETYSSPKAFYDVCPTLVKYCDDKHLIEQFCSLSIPKIYLYGSENKDSLSFLKYLEKNNCCEIAGISKSNHFPFYDNPEEYYKVVNSFVLKY